MNPQNRAIRLLGLVLGVQLLLVAATWLTGGRSPGQQSHALLALDAGDITALEISTKPGEDGKPAESVKLVKEGTEWVVSTAGNYPAQKDKVEEIVKKLAAMKVKQPLATQAANHNALRVGKETYGKDVVVTAGSTTKKLVVGSGASSSIHIRFADSNDVYQGRGLSEYQVSSSARSYVEPQYIKSDSDKLSAIRVQSSRGTLTFRKDATKWNLAELPPGVELDDSKVTAFVSQLARVSLDRPVGKEITSEMGLEAGVTVVLEGMEADKPITIEYVVGAQAGAAETDGFYVKAKDNAFVVVASKWATEGPRTKVVDDFIKKPEQAAADANGEAGQGMMPPGMMPPGMMPPGFAPPGGE